MSMCRNKLYQFSSLLLSASVLPFLTVDNYANAADFVFTSQNVITNIDMGEGTDTLTATNSTFSGTITGGTDETDTVTFTGSTFTGTAFDLETGDNIVSLDNSTFTTGGTTFTMDGTAAGDYQTLTLSNGTTFNNPTLVFTVGSGSIGTITVDNSNLTLGGNLAPGNGTLILDVSNSGTVDLGANNITGGTSADQLIIEDATVTAGTVDLSSGDNVVRITGTGSLVGNLTTGSGENNLTFGGTGAKVTGTITLAGQDNILTLDELNTVQANLNALDFTALKTLTVDGGAAFDPDGASTTFGTAGEALVLNLQNGAQFQNNFLFVVGGASAEVNFSGGSALNGNLRGTSSDDVFNIAGGSTLTGNITFLGGDDTLNLDASDINGNVDMGNSNTATLLITNSSTVSGTIDTNASTSEDIDIDDSTITGLITLSGAGTKDIELSGSTFTAGFDIDGAGDLTFTSSGDQFDGNIDVSGTTGNNSLSFSGSSINADIIFDTDDDTLTVENSSFANAINAGAGGTDELILSGTGSLASDFNQFENFSMNGTAWTLNTALTLEGGGTAAFNSGTFTIASGNSFTTTNSATTVSNGATLSLAGTLDAGSGTFNNTGTLSFSGGTLTSTGLISLGGTLSTGTGGTITGDGTDGNPVTLTGTITGSDSSTVLTINDDLTLNNGSTINSTVTSGGAASLVSVAGAGSVIDDSAGGITLNLMEDGSTTPADGDTFTLIVSANGGIDSSNYVLTDDFLFFSFDLDASDANTLVATATESQVEFASLATNSSTKSVATALDNGTISAELDAIISGFTTNSEFVDFLETQSGVVTTGTVNAVGSAASQITDVVRGRISRVGGANVSELTEDGVVIASSEAVPVKSLPKREYWIEAAAGFGSVDGDANAQGSEHNTYGLAFGAEQNFSSLFRAGLFGAVSYTGSDVDGLEDDSKTIAYRGGLYTGLDLGQNWHFSGSVSGAYIDYDTSRSTVSGEAKAEFDGYGAFANVEVAYDYQFAGMSAALSPYVGLDGSVIQHNDYNETGAGALNMSVDGNRVEKLSSNLGLQFTGEQKGKDLTAAIVARVGWAHEFLDQSASQSSRFISSPTVSFSSNGPEVTRDSAKIGLTLSAKSNAANYLFYAKYDGELSRDLENHLFAAGIKFQW
ncbi:MAG: autotransporter domain-containing protein [Sneathiellales bacterium]|nr:autotransporter domain-containing protein [Sneathiellales bacterium]